MLPGTRVDMVLHTRRITGIAQAGASTTRARPLVLGVAPEAFRSGVLPENGPFTGIRFAGDFEGVVVAEAVPRFAC
jgi:hypothetical protein